MPKKSIPVALAALLPCALLLGLLAYPETTLDPVTIVGAVHPAQARASNAALYVAGELLEHAETPDEMRAAIATAVVVAAPVREAAAFLAKHAAPDLYAATQRLGARVDGRDALRARYYDLLFLGEDDGPARALLVAGLVDLSGEELTSIAQMDPSPRVRAQAWRTLSLADTFPLTGDRLNLLVNGFARRRDPETGLSAHGALHALARFLPRAWEEDSELLPGLRALAQSIAEAPDTGERERACALRLLKASGASSGASIGEAEAPRAALRSPG